MAATFKKAITRMTERVRHLAGDLSQSFFGVLALGADATMEAHRLAVKAGWLRTVNSPPDALGPSGRERHLERSPYESDAEYRTRLLDAWDHWSKAGTRAFAALVLEPLGVEPANVATKYPPDADWSDGNDDNWSRFWIVLTNPAPWTLTTIGDGSTIGDGKTIGSDATFEEVGWIRRMLRRAKAAHEVGVQMILAPNTDVVGLFEVGDGTVLGDTAVRWKLGQFVGDGSVIGGVHPTIIGQSAKVGTVLH